MKIKIILEVTLAELVANIAREEKYSGKIIHELTDDTLIIRNSRIISSGRSSQEIFDKVNVPLKVIAQKIGDYNKITDVTFTIKSGTKMILDGKHESKIPTITDKKEILRKEKEDERKKEKDLRDNLLEKACKILRKKKENITMLDLANILNRYEKLCQEKNINAYVYYLSEIFRKIEEMKLIDFLNSTKVKIDVATDNTQLTSISNYSLIKNIVLSCGFNEEEGYKFFSWY